MASLAWCGQVSLEVEWPGQALKDLELHTSNENVRNQLKSADLAHLSFLDSTCIPLHLIAGPPLQVYTSNAETAAWMDESLMSQLNIEANSYSQLTNDRGSTGFQSSLGVLLHVEQSSTMLTSSPRITELLLYAYVPPAKDEQEGWQGMITPPRSSSPLPGTSPGDAQESFATIQVQILAVPLSSDLRPPPPPVSEPSSPNSEPRFLPTPPTPSNPLKRQRLDSLFSDATSETKRAKRKGGSTVSKIMASSALPSPVLPPSASRDSVSKQPEMRVRKVPKPLSRSNTAPTHLSHDLESPLPPMRGTHSRSGSMAGPGSRPQSRSGPLGRTQKSSLHRIASLSRMDTNLGGSVSPNQSPGPETPRPGTPAFNETEQTNKSSLSKIVMAGMRLYGLVQRKRNRRSSEAIRAKAENAGQEKTKSGDPEWERDREKEEDEGYKLVYHQTYKSAAFVLRRQIGKEIIGQDAMRDAVDRLLAMFCVDPKESSRFGGLEDPVPDTGAQGTPNAFDQPSSSAAQAQSHDADTKVAAWGS